MIVLLRFVGVMNAAVWLGAAVFFLCGVTPATLSDDMKQLLTNRTFSSYSGILNSIYHERFVALQIWCGAIALVHQLAEWLYLGRRLHRATTWLVGGLLVLGLAGGFWFQPKLQELHGVAYSYRKTPQGYQSRQDLSDEERGRALKSLKIWQRIGLGTNWLAVAGLVVLVWRISSPGEGPRYVPANNFRG